MGLDGGTYITRSDVLRGQSWELNKSENSRSTRGGAVTGIHKKARLDPAATKQVQWSTCLLSGQSLQCPIVADFLGNLYNKEAVLEFLLAQAGQFANIEDQHRYLNQRRKLGSSVDHLNSKRDVFSIDVTSSQGPKPDEGPFRMEEYRCPITDLPCTSHPFAALSKCGHLFSQRAIDQMIEEDCSICGRPFNEMYVIPINGSEEQIKDLRGKLEERRMLEKLNKRKQKHDEKASLESCISKKPKMLTL